MSGVPSEETRALGGLPPADRTLLDRPPLQLAVAEIRFEPMLSEFAADLGLRLRTRLAELDHQFAQLDRAQQGQISINMPPGGAPEPQVQTVMSGWRLQDAGGHNQVTLLPGMVAVQTSKYERWSVSLRPLLEAALTVTSELLSPAVVSRIGLRYINRFADPLAQSPSAWKGKIHDELLGPIRHPVLGEHVRSAQQQIELTLGDNQGALMRHGPIVDPIAGGAISYLVDIDVYDTEPSGFDPQELVVRSEYLNRTSASLFQQSLTPDFFKSLLAATEEATP